MLPYHARILTPKGAITIGELYELENNQNAILLDERFSKNGNVALATGVIRLNNVNMVEITTQKGYRIVCSRDHKLTVLRAFDTDRKLRNIVEYTNVKVSSLEKNSEIMLYKQDTSNKSQHWFRPKMKDEDSHLLSIIMMYIITFPERFIRSSGDEKLLMFDTIKTKKPEFRINDINYFRYFTRLCDYYINNNKLMLMRNLHYFSYKSHIGELMYNLQWLHEHLKEERDFDINSLYREEHVKGMFKLNKVSIRTWLNKFMALTFAAAGSINNTMTMVHESDFILRTTQEMLLYSGIITSLSHRKASKCLSKKWRKFHPRSHFSKITWEQYIDLKDPCDYKLWCLDVDKKYIDLFHNMTSVKKDTLSDIRGFRYRRLISNASRSKKRGYHWDKIKTIKNLGVMPGYKISVPSSGKLIVNGIVTGD